MVLWPLQSRHNKHRSQTRQEVSGGPVGANMPESPAALSSATAVGFRRMRSEGSLGGGGREVCQPWGPASFLIIPVQHVQKANSGFFLCSLQQRERCGWNQLPQELWVHQLPEMLMPGEAEGLEPDGRAGVSSILLRKVPSAVTHSGVNVCFTVLAVLHDHPRVSVTAPCLLLLRACTPHPCIAQNSGIPVFSGIRLWGGQSPQAQSCTLLEVAAMCWWGLWEILESAAPCRSPCSLASACGPGYQSNCPTMVWANEKVAPGKAGVQTFGAPAAWQELPVGV